MNKTDGFAVIFTITIVVVFVMLYTMASAIKAVGGMP